jgi:hypothetical protein
MLRPPPIKDMKPDSCYYLLRQKDHVSPRVFCFVLFFAVLGFELMASEG